jgi:hypothetical protein
VTITVRSLCDVFAPEDRRHGASAWVAEALMPQSCVSGGSRANFYVSNYRRELTGKSLKVMEVVVHAERGGPIAIGGGRLV